MSSKDSEVHVHRLSVVRIVPPPEMWPEKYRNGEQMRIFVTVLFESKLLLIAGQWKVWIWIPWQEPTVQILHIDD